MSWDEITTSGTVLIVDDTEANLIALEAALSPLNVRIIAARSGAEALELIETTPFAVALVDVQMPGMDGFELAQHARKTKLGLELPIIFVTAVHSDESCVRRGYANGAADYITKPYDALIVRARVKAFVDLYQQREGVRRGQVALRTQERDEATRRMVAFERIASAALETNDLTALLDELLRAFLDAADAADSATILLRDGDYLSVAASIGLEVELREPARTRVGSGFAGLVAAQRRPLELVGDAIKRLVQSVPEQESALSVVYGVPLLHDGQLVGVAHIGSVRAVKFSSAEKRLFEAAAERVALAVAKQQRVSALNEILDTAPAYVAIVNSDTFEYLFANPMLRDLMQAPLVGGKLDEQAWGKSIGWALGKARATGQPTLIDELAIRARPGRATAFLQLNVQPLRSGAGVVDRLLLFGTDITAQVNARKQLERAELERVRLLENERRAREAAELASLAKDEFLATVSHELRTPLSAILGWASLARSRSRADVDGALAIIERNARAQARIVEDVLDFSGMSRGKMQLALAQVDLRDVARAAMESVRPAADAKGIRIDSQLDESCVLLGDPGRLQQVVWNLLNNAVKYTGQGGRIALAVESVDRARRLSVVDTGQGIEAEFLPHVFEAFRQANGTTTRRHGGLGLGLAIVNQIVEAHGGTIEAYSDGPGRGSRFTVELLAEGNPAGAKPISTEVERTSDLRIRLDGLKVLIVDDDTDGREFMAQVLSQHGALVSAFPSANLALSEFKRLRPDVLVSDIAMPAVDGYELIRQVRALDPESGGRTPALAVTAHAGKDVMERVLESGFQRYTAKPLDVPELLVCVSELAHLGGETARSVSN